MQTARAFCHVCESKNQISLLAKFLVHRIVSAIMAPLKIIVIGGGIGGPAVAAGLAKNGHQVTLYERSTETSKVGFAFRITMNSDRCLRFLDIDAIAGGAVSANIARQFHNDGRLVWEHKEDQKEGEPGAFVFAYRVGRPISARHPKNHDFDVCRSLN